MTNALIIFVKNPERGKVKTRLSKSIGDDRALAVYEKLLDYTRMVARDVDARKILFYSSRVISDNWDPNIFEKRLQTGDDLGQRMLNAFQTVLPQFSKAVIIGSDSMEITKPLINEAFRLLDDNDVVIGPARDGGYYLLGMKTIHADLFKNKIWSTPSVSHDTVDDTRRLGLSLAQLPPLSDIDDIKDLLASPLRDMVKPVSVLRISIVIPTRNEAKIIDKTLSRVLHRSDTRNIAEIIVVDGESSDSTPGIASAAGARVIPCKPGRGRQLDAGAKAASGDVLYFLHADCIPPHGFDKAIINAVLCGYNSGCFRLRFDAQHPILSIIAWFSRFRISWVRAGDQSLFVKKETFWKAGGYDAHRAIMEDVEIIPRLKRISTFVVIPLQIISSARKYMERGIIKLQAIYIIMRIMDVQGHSPRNIYHFYKKCPRKHPILIRE
nr:TIGR04283 family arsenosugar biosynthesis glycosyltransferase [Candidatus Sigynarchaeota archaeon]